MKYLIVLVVMTFLVSCHEEKPVPKPAKPEIRVLEKKENTGNVRLCIQNSVKQTDYTHVRVSIADTAIFDSHVENWGERLLFFETTSGKHEVVIESWTLHINHSTTIEIKKTVTTTICVGVVDVFHIAEGAAVNKPELVWSAFSQDRETGGYTCHSYDTEVDANLFIYIKNSDWIDFGEWEFSVSLNGIPI
ncbi:MAG: hypothetical protein ACYTHN_22585, partial [Planctomycetota bacterium]